MTTMSMSLTLYHICAQSSTYRVEANGSNMHAKVYSISWQKIRRYILHVYHVYSKKIFTACWYLLLFKKYNKKQKGNINVRSLPSEI